MTKSAHTSLVISQELTNEPTMLASIPEEIQSERSTLFARGEDEGMPRLSVFSDGTEDLVNPELR